MVMSYLLDTNAWVQYLNRRDTGVARKIEGIAPVEVHFCSVVKAELYYGGTSNVLGIAATSFWNFL